MNNKILNIALLGLGTVGSGVPKIISAQSKKIKEITGMELKVSKALVHNPQEMQDYAKQYGIELVAQFSEILHDPKIDVVVELMGRINPAYEYIKASLENKKHVITANKDLLAVHGRKLSRVALENQVNFYYEAAVAGGIPILRTLANSLSVDYITEVLGIVNGTTNYMLTKMSQDNLSYDQALQLAQELGFAESDPTNDVAGIDASYKMVLLSLFAYGMSIEVSDVPTTGIQNISAQDVAIADSLGYVFKLIGRARLINQKLSVEVAPMLLEKKHQLAQVKNEQNAIFVKSKGIGESMYYGPGAGQLPTATSVVADLANLADRINNNVPVKPFTIYHQDFQKATDSEVIDRYYFNIKIPNLAGQLVFLVEFFSKAKTRILKIIQQENENGDIEAIVITNSMTAEQASKIIVQILESSNFYLVSCYKIVL